MKERLTSPEDGTKSCNSSGGGLGVIVSWKSVHPPGDISKPLRNPWSLLVSLKDYI